jgi:hypothetical protein
VLRLALTGSVRPVFGNALFAEYEALLARGQLWVNCALSEDERSVLFETLLSVSA